MESLIIHHDRLITAILQNRIRINDTGHEIFEKIAGLQTIMKHYSERDDWEFKDSHVDGTAIFKLTVTNLSCKAHEKKIKT